MIRNGLDAAVVTVNEMVAQAPATLAVFNRLGIDACCGGAVSLEAAAARDGVELDQLLDELEGVVGGAA
jgi:iron-sulfur cluster repair protein YtfE (RIC family)